MMNEKIVAMIVLLILGVGAYLAMPATSDKIVLPIITGIAGFITGGIIGDRREKPTSKGGDVAPEKIPDKPVD
jgi:hydrogenase/urease accessory protein HupE